MLQSFLYYCCIIPAVFQTVWLLAWLIALAFRRNKADVPVPAEALPFVSLIVCARNESKNLQVFLPALLGQRYKNLAGEINFELIVVNDCSTDNSSEILAAFREKYSWLKTVEITSQTDRLFPGKKQAVHLGVQAARSEWLVFTDADCKPESETWMQLLVEELMKGHSISGGYAPLRGKSGFLQSFIQWETLHSFIQYSAYASLNIPYMIVGRNMACHQSAYLQAKALPAYNKIPSGDDDLMVQALKQHQTVGITWNRNAACGSAPPADLQSWIRQKSRHLSTGKFYKPLHKLLLGSYALSHGFFWLSLVLCFFITPVASVWIFISIRIVLYWILGIFAALKLRERRIGWIYPVFDFCWALYNLFLSPYIFWKNQVKWK